MSQYLLSIYQPDGPVPDADFLEPIMRDLESLQPGDEGGRRLGVRRRTPPRGYRHRPADRQGDEVLITDGPFTEGKEHLGGFTIIDVDDLDAALDWARRLAKIVTLPVEVRPSSTRRSDAPMPGHDSGPGRPRPAGFSLRGDSTEAIARIFRREYGRAVAVLVRVFGNIDIAEDAVQDAFTAAVQRWPSAGIPPSPAGWIITTARNRAIDRLRRDAAGDDKYAQAALLHSRDGEASGMAPEDLLLDELAEEAEMRDDTLRLIFTCCHPALGTPARVALTLQAPRRADHRRDRPGLYGARIDHGPAAGPGQGENPGRPDSLPCAPRRGTAGAADGRARRRLPHLQRGLQRELRRGADPGRALRGGRPAGPAPCFAHAGRTRSPGASWHYCF